MLYVENIMKDDGFDFKAMFASKGMSITPFQDKDIIVPCLPLNARSGVTSCSLQKPRQQHGIKIQRVMGKMVSIIRRGLSRGSETVFIPGERITVLSLLQVFGVQ